MAKAIITQQRAKDLTAQQRANELAAQQKAEAERRAAEQRRAEEERRAAEERARRKAAIRSQIQQCDTQLDSVNRQLSGLEAEQSRLNTYLGEWSAQKGIYSGNAILSEVVIANVFEGVCADRIKADLSSSIAQMDRTYGGVSALSRSVSMQIVRLRQQVSAISARRTSLNHELNSI